MHTPGSISLIGDYFEHENRSKANSVYVAAISFGIGLANLTSLINNRFGWRECSLIVSLIGIAISLLGFTIYEPERTDDRGNYIQMETEIALSKANTGGIGRRSYSVKTEAKGLEDLKTELDGKNVRESEKVHQHF